MDWRDVETQLQGRVMEVVQHLLPHGKREGGEWVCGNIDGQPGRSLKVNVAGKPGMWSDFADSNVGGKTIMSLWCKVRNKEFRECIREAKDFLGIRDGFQNPRVTHVDRPEPREESAWKAVADSWARSQPIAEGGPVWKYLVEKRRIEPVILEAFQVREMISHSRWAMLFPYFADMAEEKIAVAPAASVPLWLKFELLDRPGGKKKEWTSPAPEKSLFGVQLAEHPAFKKCNSVLICEGEKDAMSWASYGCGHWGVLPVSVPFGAKWKGQFKGKPSPNREWIDRNWEWLQGFEVVYVAMDADEAGQRAAADIINEIGPRRCRLVTLPGKEGAK